MAKKIRFPLETADGAEVRDLEELQEHFDLETVAEYYKNGKLLTWLRDRYFEDEAAAIEALDESSSDFQRQLCGIFKVEFTGEQINLEAVAQRQERLARLREFTDEEEFINHIDQVAFDQEELADLLDEGTENIYLCGAYFTVPASCNNVTYIGISQPTVHISGLKTGARLSASIHFKQLKVENLPSMDNSYASLDSDWQECYTVHKGDTIPEGVKETDSIEAWLTRSYKSLKLDPTDKVKLVAAPKLDGIAIRGEITPENRLVNPMSRGDEARSILVKGLNGVRFLDSSKSLNKEPFGCQFEAFLTYDDTERASDYLEKKTPFVSPRHAASGLINRLCTDQDAKMVQLLCFYPINSEGLDGSYLENLKKIQKLGNCPEDIVGVEVLEGDMPELLKRIKKYFNHLNDIRSSLIYPIDGLVLSFAEKSHQSELGRSGRTNKWQMALKFDPSSAVGKVKGIELSPGKKGFRTIQLCLTDPVIVDGVKYDHIPILSAEIFDRLRLCKGDDVRVHRVGDVIPTISVEKRHDGDKLELPDKCPICGQKMIREAKKLKCVNMDCNANHAGKLLTFFDIARIKGIGDAVAADLVEAGFHDVIDIIETDADSKKFTKAGFSEKRAKELQKQILDAFEWMRDYEVVAAMGFPGVGIAIAKKIVERSISSFGSNAAIVNGKLDNIREYSHTIKCGAEEFVAQAGNSIYSVVMKYAPYIKNFSDRRTLGEMKLVGHTGTEITDSTRKIIREIGWDVVDGTKFDYLVVPSHSHNSNKVNIAKNNNIAIFTEFEFINKINSLKRANGTDFIDRFKKWRTEALR